MSEQTTEGNQTGGAWVAYYADYSGISIFGSEIEALRHAIGKSMQVVFVPWGNDLR